MGNYVPHDSSKRPSVIETLIAAEEDHFLDCPNAEVRLRLAALLLDVLLSALAISGLQHLCTAFQTHLGHLPVMENTGTSGVSSLTAYLTANSYWLSNFIFVSLKIAFAYFYFVWSLAFAGGSPGKLMLGLRVIDIRNGQPPPFTSALLREITKVLGIALVGGLIPFLNRPDRRAGHDLLANTVVKRTRGRL